MDINSIVLLIVIAVAFFVALSVFSSNERVRNTQGTIKSNARFKPSNFWIAIDFVPERCDKEYEISSNTFPSSDRTYTTNPYRFQCDCNWVKEDVATKLEEDVPAQDIRRFCRHMVAACRLARVFSREVNEGELPLLLRTLLRDGHRHHRMRVREVESRKAIIAYNINDEWVNIFFESPKKTKFSKYGFNLNERRWAYSNPPRGLSRAFRQIIEEEVFESAG